MTARRRPRSDLFRVCVRLLVTIVVVLLVLATGTLAPGDGAVDATATLVPVHLLGRPRSTALSVGWSAASFSRLDEQALRSAASFSRLDEQALRSAASFSRLDEQALRSTAEEEARGERRLLSRMAGATGVTGTTLPAALPAAVPAIVVTVAIAQRTESRSEPLSLAAALLAVASSWVLMVLSVAQACLRLELRSPRRSQVRFAFEEAPHFSDDATLALLLSTTAATVSAEIRSREGWRLVRANVVIASAFDSVVIAMTVSLLFGGLAA
ncbi:MULTISPECIES: DUF1345 domain-containing protein [unclassified Rathayibacter]|uniref:DUF1345 domain-containing protein n=1 Tax=unclassified Rathayibacter TaxID=2609250 RepID=UPI000CE88CE7|nr:MULTISPECIES: DUF1345 domain-containing protein [unclassified Rathayibacter]PPF23804.1 hypothetical protein C5C54_17125 [Rathayibacter sp. AY1F2]PPH40858.1 hypothetical protein C5C42_17185 [Rathayibacter sp. AY1F7]